jgi:hypothetical protein
LAQGLAGRREKPAASKQSIRGENILAPQFGRSCDLRPLIRVRRLAAAQSESCAPELFLHYISLFLLFFINHVGQAAPAQLGCQDFATDVQAGDRRHLAALPA